MLTTLGMLLDASVPIAASAAVVCHLFASGCTLYLLFAICRLADWHVRLRRKFLGTFVHLLCTFCAAFVEQGGVRQESTDGGQSALQLTVCNPTLEPLLIGSSAERNPSSRKVLEYDYI